MIGWGSSAWKCSARDRWIGRDSHLQFRRLHLIVNNVRFLILPDWHLPNLASRLLTLNVKRLSGDWTSFHGHPVLLAETFVDRSRFHGTCYRAVGWHPPPRRTHQPMVAGALPIGRASCCRRRKDPARQSRSWVKTLSPTQCHRPSNGGGGRTNRRGGENQ